MKEIINKSKKIFFVILSAVVLSSCGVWEDFTTYFNTYFNARNLFDQARENISAQRKDIFEFKRIKPTGANEKDLTSVIEKCSKILQFNAESAYFDDALLMIGQSFYYQTDYSKAKRKFVELLNVEETDLLLECRLWLGMSELQLRNFEDGIAILDDVRDSARVYEEEDILEQTYIEKVAFYIYREEYQNALTELDSLTNIASDETLIAKAYYQAGILYIETGDDENAAASFAKVPEYSPEYEIEFNSRFENARLLRKLEKDDESLALLEELRDEDKNIDYFGKIDYEIGMIYYDRDELDKAMDKFRDVDTTYRNTEAAGKSNLELGKIWENIYSNFDSAQFYYENAIASQIEPELKEFARDKKSVFDKYYKLKSDIKRHETGLLYAIDTSAFIADSIAYEEYLNRDTTEFVIEQYDDQGNLIEEKAPELPVKSFFSEDSLRTLISDIKFELGNLFLSELEKPDSAYNTYMSIDRSHTTDNFNAQLYFAIGTYYETIEDPVKADSMYSIVYNNYRFSEVANEAARKLGLELIAKEKDPSELLYQKAEGLIEEEQYNTAIDSLYTLYNKYPDSYLAARSLYTIGYLLENNIGNKDSAAVIYDSLYTHYKSTDYGRAVSPKLTFYKQEQKRVTDSVKAAEKAIADSLAAIEAENTRIADSIATANGTVIDSASTTVQDSLMNTPEIISDSTSVNETEQPDSLFRTETVPADTSGINNNTPEENTVLPPNSAEPDTGTPPPPPPPRGRGRS